MRLLIATDAWEPQVNGVVRTLIATIDEISRRGITVELVEPSQFRNAALPGYPEIRIAWPRLSVLRQRIGAFRPEHIHIATEGPIGWAVRRIARQTGCAFTTSYHTRFPEYVRARLPLPLNLSYRALRRFHNAGQGVMVATASIASELASRGFRSVLPWGRGVDLSSFRTVAPMPELSHLPRPLFLSVGRLAPEKNLEAFLRLELPGTKVVVGDGPSAAELKARFPEAVFVGARPHADLPAIYSSADVFVFPSLTDTFGLVLVEALACGLPVAAFPAPGPRDVVGVSGAGVLSQDLGAAAIMALSIDPSVCRSHAANFTWSKAADQFLANIRQICEPPAGLLSAARTIS
jgi:glycosyltransferase involved in cell wall biosynthesis